jgi:hypothetical protein
MMAHRQRLASFLLLLLIPLPFATVPAAAQTSFAALRADSDGDGLSDALEQAILQRFEPTFFISPADCAAAPVAFAPDAAAPTPVPHSEGTIYGQVFPAPDAGSAGRIEVHYYHLWARDCGQHGHPLDAERVSVLLEPTGNATSPDNLKAIYWYASAHEGTVCDSSRLHRAAAVAAETSGPSVWISRDKHASFLERPRCDQGCGADRCDAAARLAAAPEVINLGEPGHVMNGATWTTAAGWQLSAKMQKSDFPAAELALLSAGAETSLAVGPRPMTGFQTAVAVASVPPQKTGMALDKAGAHTDNALQKAADSTRRSLKLAFTSTVGFLSRH